MLLAPGVGFNGSFGNGLCSARNCPLQRSLEFGERYHLGTLLAIHGTIVVDAFVEITTATDRSELAELLLLDEAHVRLVVG